MYSLAGYTVKVPYPKRCSDMPGTCSLHVPGNLNVETLQDRKKIILCTRYHIEEMKARSIKSSGLKSLKRSSEGGFRESR